MKLLLLWSASESRCQWVDRVPHGAGDRSHPGSWAGASAHRRQVRGRPGAEGAAPEPRSRVCEESEPPSGMPHEQEGESILEQERTPTAALRDWAVCGQRVRLWHGDRFSLSGYLLPSVLVTEHHAGLKAARNETSTSDDRGRGALAGVGTSTLVGCGVSSDLCLSPARVATKHRTFATSVSRPLSEWPGGTGSQRQQ